MTEYRFKIVTLASDRITGWAYDTARPQEQISVVLSVDGVKTHSFVCDRKRNDLDESIPNHSIGFLTYLPLQYRDGETHTLTFSEARTNQVLGERTVTFPNAVLRNADSLLIFGELTTVEPTGVSGWVTDKYEPLLVTLEIDGRIVGSAVADKSINLDVQRPAGFRIEGFPHLYYDGAEHTIRVRVPGAIVGEAKLVLQPEDKPRISGKVIEVENGVLKGSAGVLGRPGLDLTLALMVDGVEYARTDTYQNAPGARYFAFDLNHLPFDHLLAGELNIVCHPYELALFDKGVNPVRDSIVARLYSDEKGGDRLSVLAGLAIPPGLAVRLASRHDPRQVRDVRLEGLAPKYEGMIEAGEILSSEDLILQIGSVEIPLSDERQAKPRRTLLPPKKSGRRPSGELCTPDDPAVQLVLSTLALEGVSAATSDSAGYSGVWRFLSPAKIEGWAIDLSAPSDPVEVELLVDGQPAALVLADQPLIPREAGIHLPLPVGFQIALNRLDVGEGDRQLQVRVAGGGSLVPSRSIRVHLDALPEPSGLVEQVDEMVADGQADGAYLLVKNVTHRSDYELIKRALVLDLAFRTNWVGHNKYLSSWEPHVENGLIDGIRQHASWRTGNSRDEAPWLPDLGFLPECYRELLQSLLPDAALQDSVAAVQRVALWSILAQIPTYRPREHHRLALVIQFPEQLLPPELDAELQQVRSLGGLVLFSPQDASAEDIDAATEGRDYVVLLSRPRLLGALALGYWPRILAETSGSPALLASTVVPGENSVVKVEFSGAIADDAIRFLVRDRECIPQAEAGGARLRSFALPPASDEARCLILHNLEDGASFPAIPFNCRLHELPAATLTKTPADISRVLVDALGAEGSNGGVPVIYLDRNLNYPASYIEDCLRHFALIGKKSFVTSPVHFDLSSGAWNFPAEVSEDYSVLGMMAQGCFLYGDLQRFARRYGDILSPGLILAEGEPFRIAKFGQSEPSFIKARLVNNTVAESEIGFRGEIASKWNEAANALSITLERRNPLARIRAGGRGWATEALELAQNGHLSAVEDYTANYLATTENFGSLSEDELKGLFDLCWALGKQDVLTRRLLPHLVKIVQNTPSLIIQLGECLATELTPEELNSALVLCTSVLVRGNSSRFVSRCLNLVRRFASPGTLLLAVSMIDESQHADLLKDEQVKSAVGDAILQAALPAFVLPNTKLSRDDFLRAASPKARLVASLLEGNRADFLAALNQEISTATSLEDVILALRTYTLELTEMRIRRDEVYYPTSVSRKDKEVLSLILNDLDSVRLYGGGTVEQPVPEGDSRAIVLASYQGDLSPLSSAFAHWGAQVGVSAVPFGGADIHGFFTALNNAPVAQKQVPSFGKVSVLVTVYNPDLDLLRLAIESIMRQTYQDLELILVDDASDEVDIERIRELQHLDDRIKYLRVTRNVGPYICRNRALEVASGDFVCIQDGDDYSHPERIEHQVRALAADPLLQMCTTEHLRIDQRARVQFEHTLELRGDGTMTSMFRRTVFSTIGKFTAVRSRGDVEFRERLKRKYGVHTHVHIPCPLVFCYASPQSLSNSTLRSKKDYLNLFRTAFAKRVRYPVIDGKQLGSGSDEVPVPYPLRAITIGGLPPL